jgi:hypothetical protein
MKLYENVIIGNFLYTLGLNIGINKELPKYSSINLLQQTPSDKALGDVLLEFPGVVRLIEFKNKKSDKEKEKTRLKLLEIALKDQVKMIEISKQIHWYIETEPNKYSCFNRIVPYLDAFNNEVYGEYTLEVYIENMVKEINEPLDTSKHQDIKNYLKLIQMTQGSSNIGTGGLIINITEKGIKYIQITDLLDLRLNLKEFINKAELELESIMKLEQKKELKKNIDQEYIRSYNR